jgi:hypothetical protein
MPKLKDIRTTEREQVLEGSDITPYLMRMIEALGEQQ